LSTSQLLTLANRPKSRRNFRTVVQKTRTGCETLTNVSPISRREFLATASSLVSGALAAGCAAERPAQSPRSSRPAQGTQPTDPSHPSQPVDPKSILIIGAGMAGLGAARSLVDAGWAALVIEDRDRIGRPPAHTP